MSVMQSKSVLRKLCEYCICRGLKGGNRTRMTSKHRWVGRGGGVMRGIAFKAFFLPIRSEVQAMPIS